MVGGVAGCPMASVLERVEEGWSFEVDSATIPSKSVKPLTFLKMLVTLEIYNGPGPHIYLLWIEKAEVDLLTKSPGQTDSQVDKLK